MMHPIPVGYIVEVQSKQYITVRPQPAPKGTKHIDCYGCVAFHNSELCLELPHCNFSDQKVIFIEHSED